MPTKNRIAALVAAVALMAGATVAGTAWATGSTATEQAAPTQAPPVANALGGGDGDNQFVPITPCRLVDTRQGGGKLAVGDVTSYLVAGAGPEFAAQGGKANGCGIPTSAAAIEVTMTAVDAGSGFLRVWPSSSGQPNATFMNYTPTFNVSNTGTVAICTTCGFVDELRVRAFGSPTHLVADVNGYYLPKLAAQVAANGTLVRGNQVVSTTRLSIGNYEVKFDRNVASCAVSATAQTSASDPVFVRATPRGNPNDTVFIHLQDRDQVNWDSPFFVEVTC